MLSMCHVLSETYDEIIMWKLDLLFEITSWQTLNIIFLTNVPVIIRLKKKKSNYASLVYWPFRIFHNFSFLSLDMKAGHPAEPSPEGFSCQTDTHTHDAAIVHIPSRTT